MHGEPFLRHLNGRGEAVGELEPSEPLYGVAPGGGRAGHGHRVDVEGGLEAIVEKGLPGKLILSK